MTASGAGLNPCRSLPDAATRPGTASCWARVGCRDSGKSSRARSSSVSALGDPTQGSETISGCSTVQKGRQKRRTSRATLENPLPVQRQSVLAPPRRRTRVLPLMQLTTGIENSRRLKNHVSANRKTGPTDSNSACLSSDASRARRHVGVLWGFGRNSGCRASGAHHTPQFVIRVASYWLDSAELSAELVRRIRSIWCGLPIRALKAEAAQRTFELRHTCSDAFEVLTGGREEPHRRARHDSGRPLCRQEECNFAE
jgi:hypothetical protein